MPRKRLRKRTIQVRVTIPEFDTVGNWAKASQTSHSTIMRELIHREERRLEDLRRAEEVAADAAAAERGKIAEAQHRVGRDAVRVSKAA